MIGAATCSGYSPANDMRGFRHPARAAGLILTSIPTHPPLLRKGSDFISRPPRPYRIQQRGRHALCTATYWAVIVQNFYPYLIASGRVVKMPSDNASICRPHHKPRPPLALRNQTTSETIASTLAPIRKKSISKSQSRVDRLLL